MAAPTWLNSAVTEYAYDDYTASVHASANYFLTIVAESTNADIITDATLGGVAMTKRTGAYQSDVYTSWFNFDKVSPTTGSQAVAFTGEDGSFSRFDISLSGVSTTSPQRGVARFYSPQLGETSISVNLTTTADDLCVAAIRIPLANGGALGTVSALSGCTIRTTVHGDSSLYVVTAPGASGTTTIGLQWTIATYGQAHMFGVAVTGSSGGGAGTKSTSANAVLKKTGLTKATSANAVLTATSAIPTVTYDVSGSFSGSSTTYTQAVNIPSNSNQVAYLMWGDKQVEAASVTLGGVNMSKITTFTPLSPEANPAIWMLKSPPTGVQSLIVTYSTAVDRAGPWALVVTDKTNQNAPYLDLRVTQVNANGTWPQTITHTHLGGSNNDTIVTFAVVDWV